MPNGRSRARAELGVLGRTSRNTVANQLGIGSGLELAALSLGPSALPTTMLAALVRRVGPATS